VAVRPHRHSYCLASGRRAVLTGKQDPDGEVVFTLEWEGPCVGQRWNDETITKFLAWRKRAELELKAEILGAST
jgi:hypothetical protein